MRRMFLPSFVAVALLAAAALRAGDWSDVPLSQRSIAPIPGITSLFGAPGEEGILTVFTTPDGTWIQRISAEGKRLDPSARPFPHHVWAASRDGDGWLLAGGLPVVLTRVGPDGVPRESKQTALQGSVTLLESPEGMFLTIVSPLSTYRVTRDLQLELVHATSIAGSLQSATPVIVDRGVGTAWVVWNFFPSGASRLRFFHAAGATGDAPPQIHETVVDADTGTAVFVPSPEGGGLFVWSDSGIRGMVLRRDGTLTRPQLLHPSDRPAVSLQGVASEEGWTILEHGMRVIEVGSEGAPRRSFVGAEGSSYVAMPGPDLALRPLSAGFSILEESAGGWREQGLGGTALASQGQVRIAEHEETALAVWSEQSFDGPVLRATRLLDGVPIDPSGIVLSEGSTPQIAATAEPQHDVIWDGENFLVAWIEGGDRRLFVRRITKGGSILPVEEVSEQAHQVRLASDGEGTAMAIWVANAGDGRTAVEVAAIHHGIPGSRIALSEQRSQSLLVSPNVAWTGSHFVALWDEAFVCRVLCPYMGNVFAQAVSREGAPMSEPVLAARGVRTAGDVVGVEGRIFVILQSGDPSGLAELRSDLTFGSPVATPFHSFPQLRLGAGQLFVDHAEIRATYSMDRRLLSYEPLPVDSGEILSAQIGERFIISAITEPPRALVIRTPGTKRRADVSVRSLDFWRPSDGTQLLRFLVENGGPDPIRVLLFPSSRMYLGNVPLYDSRLMELPPGSSIEVSVAMDFGRPARLCAAGDAEDRAPENNCAGANDRKRAVRREARP